MSPDRRRVTCPVWMLSWGLLAACFEPDLPACLACDGVCPAGQRCVDGRCVAEGQRCSGARDPGEGEPSCSPAGCCIGAACFERDDAGEFRIASWLDWTSIVTGGSEPTFEVWQDRSGQRHAARPQRSDVLPRVRPVAFRDGQRAVVERAAADDYLVLDQEPGDVLDALGRRDFFVVAAVALDCGPRERRACVVSKWSTPPRGFIVAVQPNGRLEAVVAECADRSPSGACMAQLGTEAGFFQCERFQLIGLRRATDATRAARLELRVNGRVEETFPAQPLNADAAGETYLGGYPFCEALRGDLAAFVAVEGAMSDREACELERTLLLAMRAADLADFAAQSCE